MEIGDEFIVGKSTRGRSGEAAEVGVGLGFVTFGVEMGTGNSETVMVGREQMISPIIF